MNGRREMRVWAIANQKGGVGKTTATVTLAALLSLRGYKTLMVDMDPQGSLSAYFGYDPDAAGCGVYDIFHAADIDARALVRNTHWEHLHLLPASTAMATLDRQLGAQRGKGAALARALKQMEGTMDFVLVDCPPMLGILMVNALAAADYLVVPAQTEFLALNGLERLMRTHAMIEQARNKPLPCMIVPNLFDRRTRASRQTLEALQARYAEHLWDLVIPVDTLFREASKAGVPLPMFDRHARGVGAYETLLDVLLHDAGVITNADFQRDARIESREYIHT